MPYDVDRRKTLDELFKRAFDEVVAEREVNENLRDANFSKSLKAIEREVKGDKDRAGVHKEGTGKYEEIWRKVETRISSYNTIEERINRNELELVTKIKRFKESRKATFFIEKVVNELVNTLGFFKTPSVLSVTEEELVTGFDIKLETDLDVLNQWTAMRLRLGIDGDIREKDTIKSQIESALFEELKQIIRLTINSRIVKPDFDSRLKIFEARGLAEVMNQSQTIDTDAKKSLFYKLRTMSGGSIGIAGSRGAGKSTLIQMCCGDKRESEPIDGVKSLPVFTTAPVQYESRDFILYLFSAVCQRVIDPDMIGDTRVSLPEFKEYSQPTISKPIINKFFNTAPRILYLFGGLLLFVTLLMLSGMLLFSKIQTTDQNTNQATAQTANQNTSNANAVNQNTTPANTEAANQNTSTVNNQNTSPAQSGLVPLVETTIGKLEIKPGTLFSWGVILLFTGFCISLLKHRFAGEMDLFPQDYEEYTGASEQQQRKWKEDAEKKVSYGRKIDTPREEPQEKETFSARFTSRLLSEKKIEQAEGRAFLKRLTGFEERKKTEKENNNLAAKARGWLNEIKFQQNFTAGWTGGLKLPAGLETGISRSIQLAQKQMTNPEIVAAFIKFMDEVAKEYTVIVGIDEMDKMESEDDAKKFLNEIKSIFGLPKCFYLISVSENAMSSFERRGMPFRDVFDSSFDDVVYVEHLNRKTAKELLLRRIDGNPQLFIYLSYCLAGGLPRDLIRNFRNLLEFNQEDATGQGKDLEKLCREIIVKEIKAKVRAISAAIRKIKVEPESGEFFEMLAELENQNLDETTLLKTVEKLFQWQSKRKLEANSNDEDKININNCREIEKISKELGCYLYFLTTIFEFFDNSLDKTRLEKALGDGDLEDLAKARQLMEINSDSTMNILTKFRSHPSRKMKIPQLKKAVASTNGKPATAKVVPIKDSAKPKTAAKKNPS